MHPDYVRSRWWAGAVNYLAMAHFTFERHTGETYVWHYLMMWAECMENLKEEEANDCQT